MPRTNLRRPRAALVLASCAAAASWLTGCNLILGIDDFTDAPAVTGTGGASGAGGTTSSGIAGGGTGGDGPSCSDGLKNGAETGKDCGGDCPSCPDGSGCIVGPDCASKVCIGGTCVAATCEDKVTNGEETDADCGGPSCAKCANGKKCAALRDCVSGVCRSEGCVDSHAWSKQIEGGSKLSGQVVLDSAGNIVVGATFESYLQLSDSSMYAFGGDDIAVGKFDAAGNHLWSKDFGDDQIKDWLAGVAVDGSDNIVVAGAFGGSIDFGGGPLKAAGGTDVFVAKLDSLGNHLWSKRFGDGQGQLATFGGVDGSGNVIVAGVLGGMADFGGGALTSAGGTDIFVAKFDPAGVHQWSHRFGDAQAQDVYTAAIDGSGNVILAGTAGGVLDFGGGPILDGGGLGFFLAKLGPNGAHVWSKGFPMGAAVPLRMAADMAGGIAVAGVLVGTIDFGGGSLVSAGSTDIFIVRFDADGKHLWSKRFGDTEPQKLYGMALDKSGGILLTGSVVGTTDFGGGLLTSAGSEDLFVAKLDSSGAHLWSRVFGSAQDQVGFSAAVDDAGDAVLLGTFEEAIDLGGGPLTTLSGEDMFIAKLRLP